jgi:hypothetical protein
MENQSLDSMQTQQTLPNATGVLVLGILSIVFCFCYGIIGITLGIIALIMGNKAIKLYLSSPELYTESSYKNVKAGKTCAIVGLCLSSLYIVFLIVYIGILGAAVGGGLLNELGNF